MKIVIATGIYGRQIGGPARYSAGLCDALRCQGHAVSVVSFGALGSLPTGLRHTAYLFKIIPHLWGADLCIMLDTFSVALPATIAALLFRVHRIVRTGGDFLWERYVERTNDLVLLKDFYKTRLDRLSAKEKIILALTHFILKRANHIVFSTAWQKMLWQEPYGLDNMKTAVIENYYGPKEKGEVPVRKVFSGAVRPLKWKNRKRLIRAFKRACAESPEISLDLENAPPEKFLEKIRQCYAVILVSLGDISPNIILEAIRFNKPFIITRETGLYDRLKDVGIFVDPENEKDIADAVLWLADASNYETMVEKVRNLSFQHSYDDMARQFLRLATQW